MIAEINDHTEIVEILIKNGTDKDKGNNKDNWIYVVHNIINSMNSQVKTTTTTNTYETKPLSELCNELYDDSFQKDNQHNKTSVLNI